VSKAETILKSTPPRLPLAALERASLAAAWDEFRERTAIVLCAPAGFGKTTLMLQWRRRWLQREAYVGWLGIDARDEPPRLVQGLLHALRVATGQACFERIAAMCALQPERELEAMTSLLAEVAGLGVETVLMVDDAERLPGPGSRELLAYLLQNAPANFHVLLATRLPLEIATAGLAARGQLGLLQVAELRLAEAESCEILAHRFGARIGLDQCVRVHDLSEGWAIALQLAAATIERSSDPAVAIEALSGSAGELGRYFLECLFASLPARMLDFLVRVSILDRLEAQACAELSGDAGARERLEWLLRETPILSESEHGSWLHLHGLARDYLRARFEELPEAERVELRRRARLWCEHAEWFHEAAHHALAEGDLEATRANAARALWSLGTQGRISEARSWLRYIPESMLAQDVELRLYAAWALVFGERNAEALAIACSTLDDPASSPRTRMIATRVAGGAAIFADRIDIVQALARAWPQVEAHHPLYVIARENGLSLLALHAGATAEVRERATRVAADLNSPLLSLALAFSRVLLALSYWGEGDAVRVESILRPALRDADFEGGRRGMVSCMIAPVLAAALREFGQPDAARAVLADRLDVIERNGEPDTMLLAYRTLAEVALDRGDERHALHVLENFAELALRRGLPRLAMAALASEVRLHAHRGREGRATELFAQLAALRGRFEQPDLRMLAPHYELALAMAAAQLALATGELDEAEGQLDTAMRLSAGGGRVRERLQACALRAVLESKRGEAVDMPRLREAEALAELGGMRCLLFDAHPMVAGLLGRARNAQSLAPAARPAPQPSAGALLTPKEAQILELLGKGLSNKEIARSLGVGEETVKWHLKNIFGKLSAGSRRHAVGRARLLGLLPE